MNILDIVVQEAEQTPNLFAFNLGVSFWTVDLPDAPGDSGQVRLPGDPGLRERARTADPEHPRRGHA